MTWLNHIAASLMLYAALGTCLARAEYRQKLLDRLTQVGVTPSLLYDCENAPNLDPASNRYHPADFTAKIGIVRGVATGADRDPSPAPEI
jgi:hypothetical protein